MAERKFKWTRRKVLKAAIDEQRSISRFAHDLVDEYIVDGRAVIPVNVDQLYNPISMGHLLQLNGDIFDYVEQSASLLPPEVPLRVMMHGVEKKDRERVAGLFKAHYELVVQDHLWDLRRTILRAIGMGVLGIVFIISYLYFAITKEGTLFLELLSVVGSFALWDSINCLLVDRHDISRELDDNAQFLLAEVDFYGEDDVPEDQLPIEN